VTAHSLQPADTATTAFVGLGAPCPPVLITDLRELRRKAGRGPLALAAQHFFANGGTRLYLLGVDDFQGNPFGGLDGLDVSLVASPGQVALAGGAGYCERRGDCFFLGDAPADAGPAEVRALAASVRSSYAALFVPWLNPEAPAPPSAFVAGALARDPVWATGGGLRGVTGVAGPHLSPDLGVNVLHPARPIGAAQTLSAEPEWKYVSIRRLSIFLEHSIETGTQWTVFEPNGEALWADLRRTIGDFLFVQWQGGAFQGSKPEEAYFVNCGRTTMTQLDIDAGIVNVVVGFAPLKPAEFVVLRIRLRAAGDDPDP
jgi:uncharacterized protein